MRRFGRQSGAFMPALGLLTMLLLGAVSARASVAVLLEEPYGTGSGMNPAGHSAIYFDHICAETPLKLRACGPGELGAVVSRYDDIDGYDWVAMPLVAYLYAVDSVDQIPAWMDRATEIELRNTYRRAHLQSVAPDEDDGSAPPGNWYQLAGSAYDRTLYGFQVKTSAEQDEHLMALLNDRKNVNRFNGMFRNCADFSRVTVNRYYPRAVKRNFIADLGMTSPKQVARALSHYAEKHPEAGFTEFVVPQVAGTLPRSHKAKCFTESIVTSKRYVVPITLVEPLITATMFVAYMGDGRFSMPKDAPVLSVQAMETAAMVPAKPAALTQTALAIQPASAPKVVVVDAEKAIFADSAEATTAVVPEY